jgi:mannose-1-phosphate guanylyltransferase
MGTGGAVKFAESLLDERFLVLNGDVLTDIDLTSQVAQHERSGARATLALTPVEDPTAYGLVRFAEDRAITEFVEKPAYDQIESNLINAGAYVLDRSVLEVVATDQNVSIEREVFPRLIGDGLYAFPADGYWLDIGTPHRYLRGTFDIIEGNVETPLRERFDDGFLALGERVQATGRIIPPALVDDDCQVAEGAQVGSLAVLGHNVKVGADTTIERAVVLAGAEIGSGCTLRDCIVAAGARVGDGTHVESEAVVGEGVTVGAGNVLTHGVRLFPGVALPDGAILF